MRYAAKWPKYADEWDRMVINPGRVAEFVFEARFAINHKATYQEAADKTGLPWPMIAVLHRRESDANFDTYLGNGQSLKHKTTEVPANRGPFLGPNAFIDGCIDAIKQEGWATISDWRLEKILFYCESFNGGGYDTHGIPSPYLFGDTNIQVPGKFVRDHVFDPHVVDPQPGCAPLLQQIAKLDPTVISCDEMAGITESELLARTGRRRLPSVRRVGRFAGDPLRSSSICDRELPRYPGRHPLNAPACGPTGGDLWRRRGHEAEPFSEGARGSFWDWCVSLYQGG